MCCLLYPLIQILTCLRSGKNPVTGRFNYNRTEMSCHVSAKPMLLNSFIPRDYDCLQKSISFAKIISNMKQYYQQF